MSRRHRPKKHVPFLFDHVSPAGPEDAKQKPEMEGPEQASKDSKDSNCNPASSSNSPSRGGGVRGVWLPRRRRALASPRVSYVYLLVHQTQNRFKIGRSLAPKTRFANLPEADEVDVLRSLQVMLRDQTRACQIESLLHKALADFRLDRLAWYGVRDLGVQMLPSWAWDDVWDGETEWFALPAFRHAVEILWKIPGLNGPPVSALQTLEGQPWLEQAFEPDPLEQQFKAMQAYNLARFDEIFDVLMVISRQHRMVWTPSLKPEMSAGSLRIESLKSQWAPDMVNVRFLVTSSTLWELKTQQPPAGKKYVSHREDGAVDEAICPIVKFITYSKSCPEDLELIFNAVDSLSTVPSGPQVLERLLAFTVGFTDKENHSASDEAMRQASAAGKKPK